MFNRKKKIRETAMKLRALILANVHLDSALKFYKSLESQTPDHEAEKQKFIAEVEEAQLRLQVAIFDLIGTKFYKKNLDAIVKLANI